MLAFCRFLVYDKNARRISAHLTKIKKSVVKKLFFFYRRRYRIMIEEAIDQNQTTKQTENYPEIGSSSGQDSNESGQSPSSSLKRMDRETKKKLYRWLGFGVFLSCVPIASSMLFDLVAGYTKLIEGRFEYLVDFLLVVFAIACNACSYATEGKVRMGLMTLSIASMGFCALFYAFSFDRAEEVFSNSIIVMFVVTGIMLLLNAYIGYRIIMHPEPDSK